MGQSESASLSVPGQESDGESSLIADASMPVEATLSIVSLDRETALAGIGLEAGASFSDRTVGLDTTIRESQRIQVVIMTPEGKLASDTALVAVGGSLSAARDQQRSGPSATPKPPGEAELVGPDPDAGFRRPYALYRRSRSSASGLYGNRRFP
jgi:hypothetical protein